MYTIKNRPAAGVAAFALLCLPLLAAACSPAGSQTSTPTIVPAATAEATAEATQPLPTDTAAPATATPAPATPTEAAQPSPATTAQAGGGPGDYRWSQVGLAGNKVQDLTIPAGTNSVFAAGQGGAWKAGYSYTNWSPLNIKPEGHTNGIAASGSESLILTSNTGCASGAPIDAFHSTDGGNTWQPVASEAKPLRVVVANSQLAYGTLCSGIAKSTDGGATWTAIPNSGIENFDPGALTIGGDGQSVYAAYYSEGGVARIMRSNSDATTWTEITPPDVELRAPIVLAAAPVTQGHPDQGGIYMASAPGQIWFLPDGTTDWKPAKSNNPESDKPQEDYQVTAMYVDTVYTEEYNKPGPVIYAARALPSDTGMEPLGVFRSTNGGLTWDQVGTGIEKQVANSLVLAPQDPSAAAVTVETLLAATDDGVWSAPLPPPFH